MYYEEEGEEERKEKEEEEEEKRERKRAKYPERVVSLGSNYDHGNGQKDHFSSSIVKQSNAGEKQLHFNKWSLRIFLSRFFFDT